MRDASVIAANRFGLGARPGELAAIDGDPRGWLLGQLPGPGALPQELRDLPSTASILRQAHELREQQRQAKRAGTKQPAPVKKFGAVGRHHYLQQARARYRNAAATDFPFHERLVHFWCNHFAVSTDKPPVTALAGNLENEAIRPHLGGSFHELLLAVEQHPAMLLYLDNQRSIGPNSPVASRARRGRKNRQPGLNENLAREILELHTLGVDGGYTQEDVTAFAKVITGWSIGGSGPDGRFAEGTPGEFEFRDNIHEPGSQVLLGRRYGQPGIAQGEAVLRDLSVHSSTATFIATKLARHFVADDPPAALVDRLAAVFLETDGDLPSLHTALVAAPEPWESMQTKYKTPQDFLVSAFRALRHVPEDARFVVGALELMGQTPYRPGSPAGWPDSQAHWGGADALLKRIEWSNTVASRAGSGFNPLDLGVAVLGPAFGDHSRTAIARAESPAQGLTMLLASPEFQRR